MGGLGFDYQAIQIGHSVIYGSPFLQRFSSVVRSCVGQALGRGDEPRHSFTYFDVIRDNDNEFFLKTYLRFLITLERVNCVMILHIHKIKFCVKRLSI